MWFISVRKEIIEEEKTDFLIWETLNILKFADSSIYINKLHLFSWSGAFFLLMEFQVKHSAINRASSQKLSLIWESGFWTTFFSWNNDPCWEDLNMTWQTGKIDHWDCFCPAWQRAQTHMITKLSVLIRTETEPTKGFSLNLLICAESSTNIKKILLSDFDTLQDLESLKKNVNIVWFMTGSTIYNRLGVTAP